MSEHLKRNIGRSQLLLISFAAIFGSGWLFAPFYAAQLAGPLSMVAWGLGAMMSAVIGITMAEVITLFPKTGGTNQIALITHGPFLSHIITLFNLVVFIVLPAIEIRAITQYLSSYWPSLTVSHEGNISLMGYLLAISLLILITWVNLYGAKVVSLLTRAIVFFKLVTPALLIVTFLMVLQEQGKIDHGRFTPLLHSWDWHAIFTAIATSGIIFSFNGFNQATLLAGEAKNPQKAIPFAIFGSLLLTSLLYLLVQYVFILAVPEASLAHGWQKLAFLGDQGPFAAMATLLGLSSLLLLIYVDAVVSPLGTAFAYANVAPRIIYSVSENNPSLAPLFKLNRYGISPITIALTLTLEIMTFIFLPSLKAMISLLVAAFVSCYTVAPVSLLRLRKTHPHLERPFRTKMAPFVSFLSLFFSNIMVFSCGFMPLRNLSILLIVTLLFLFLASLKDLSRHKKDFQGVFWFAFQLFFLTALSAMNLSFPLSLLIIAFLCVFILVLAMDKRS